MKTLTLALLIAFSTFTAAHAEWEMYDIGMPAQIKQAQAYSAPVQTVTQPASPSTQPVNPSTTPVVAQQRTQQK
jgi:hypothetical protein